MDGCSSRKGIIVLAATNQPDVLDKVLLGPGRFDRRVVVNLPDKNRRQAIPKAHTRKVPRADDVDPADIAQATPGVSGAEPVHRVTILPRGQALGVAYQRPQTDRYNHPQACLRAKIIGMLGGRAAEAAVYGTRTTGSGSDMEEATAIAHRWSPAGA